MSVVMENTEQKSSRVQVGANLDPTIFREVSRIAIEEDRSVSNTINQLLKTHPRIAAEIGAETAEA